MLKFIKEYKGLLFLVLLVTIAGGIFANVGIGTLIFMIGVIIVASIDKVKAEKEKLQQEGMDILSKMDEEK